MLGMARALVEAGVLRFWRDHPGFEQRLSATIAPDTFEGLWQLAESPGDWRDGLALTGHFLARDAFGAHHRPLPQARQMLYDRVAALAAESERTEGSNAG